MCPPLKLLLCCARSSSCDDMTWQNVHVMKWICTWRCGSKISTNFFFLLHNFMGTFVLIVHFSHFSVWLFSFLLSQELSFTFSLKGSDLQLLFEISKLSTSLLLCFGPFLNKIKVTEHKHRDTSIVDLMTKMATKGLTGREHTQQIRWSKRWLTSCRKKWDLRAFTVLLRMACNLKLTNCFFLEFSI